MPDIENQSNEDPPFPYTEPDMTFVAIPSEHASCLRHLIAAARADLRPRNFAERYLVDEMALCKWRQRRILLMERAVYDHESVNFDPEFPKDEQGNLLEPLEDYYFLAQLHLPERQGLVLEALSRLELRYHRQFASALRLLNSIRRNPDFQSTKEQPK